MLANKGRILQKMEEFDLDVIIASHPENVSYLSDYQSHMPYMYRFFNIGSYAIFPRKDDISPVLIVPAGDVAWEARFPSWFKEVYTIGNSFYITNSEGTLGKEENKFKLENHCFFPRKHSN